MTDDQSAEAPQMNFQSVSCKKIYCWIAYGIQDTFNNKYYVSQPKVY